MLHGVGQAPERPIEVRWVLGVNGPKGLETAASMGTGVFTRGPRPGASFADLPSATLLGFGTGVREGEIVSTERVWEAAGAPAAALSPLTGTVDQIRARVEELIQAGMTEIAFQPVGDIEAELRTMAEAMGPWI